jgi:O-antigen/teichoic acid export membrane protein
MRRLQVHPIVRDLTVTAAACLANLAAGLFVISLFGHLWGLALLGEYLLLRRVANWFQPVAHLGMGVALPRYIAFSINRSPGSELEYFVASAACIVGFNSVFGLLMYHARNSLSHLLFGDAQLSPLIAPLCILMLGMGAQAAVYGYYRGGLQMKRAGALQVAVALAPLIAATTLYRLRSVPAVVGFAGCLISFIAAGFAVPVLRRLHRCSFLNVRKRAAELLKYGLSRLPGDLSTGALLSIGPVVAMHFVPITVVSQLLIASAMLVALSVSTEPLGLVFLSKISMMLAGDRKEDVRKYATCLAQAAIDLSVFLTIQVLVFADILVGVWIGPSASKDMAVIRLVLIGVPFYIFYSGLRSVIDAGSILPRNAFNTMASLTALGVMISLCPWMVPRAILVHAIGVSLVISLGILACLTAASLRSLYAVRLQWKESIIPICSAFAFGAVALGCRRWLGVHPLALGMLELLLGSAFLLACFRSGVPWARLLWTLLFPRQATVQDQQRVA